MTPERWQQVNEILEEAWERAGTERREFLDQACSGDPLLREKVEALLAADEDASGFWKEPPPGLAEIREAVFAPTIDGALDDFLPGFDLAGTRVGKYTIHGLIGKGGMGAVYRATREDDFRMEVAIKLLKRGTDTDATLERFRSERQILAGLQHPNIARLIDGGATDDGLPYLVMEYVDGLPLLQHAAPLPVRRRLELFRAVCHAVQYAHEKRIIHRDIKPTNILVTPGGVPKLLDFGIAKLVDPAAGAASDLTLTGMRLMTPDYASPEQVRGQRIEPATDVYSLGAVLYELLTGERAHRIQSLSVNEIEREICTREPRKPSAVVKELDSDLDAIVLKALRKEPERRYTSAAELADDLDRYLQNRPVKARRETMLYRGRKFVKRSRLLVITSFATAAVVLGLVAGFDRFRSPAGSGSNPLSIAVMPLENASHDAGQEPFVDGMTDSLIGKLSRIRSLRVISRDSVMRYKGARKPAGSIASELNVSTLVEGSVIRMADRVSIRVRLRTAPADRILWSQVYERDIRNVSALQNEVAKAISREIQVRLTPREDGLLSRSREINQQAYESYLKGRYEWYKEVGNRESLERGMSHFRRAIELDPAYAPAWAGLADVLYTMSGLYLPPADAMPRARAAALRALAIDADLPEAHATLAQIQAQYDWDWTGAEKSYQRTIELDPSYAHGHFYYSQFLAEQGRMADAVNQAVEAWRLNPLARNVGGYLAWLYYVDRQPDRAIETFGKVQQLDPVPADLLVGLVYEFKGQFDRAIAEFKGACALEPSSDWPLALMGHAYAVAGQRAQAVGILNQLMEARRKRQVDPYYIGLIYVGLGDKEKAFEWFEKAYREKTEELLMLKVEPQLDPIRSDPRFHDLVRRLGLPM